MIVEPKMAVPERVGSEVSASGSVVTEEATDHRFVVPALFVFVVRAVMNLPASAET